MIPPKERDRAILAEMANEIAFVKKVTEKIDADTFLRDALLQRALVMSLQIIGECSAHLSGEFRESNTEIPWEMVVGLRNRISHGYHRIDMDMVWEFVERDIPILERFINSFINIS